MVIWAALVIFLFAALRDLTSRRIDDGLVVALLLLWGVSASAGQTSGAEVLMHLATGGGAFVLMWLAFIKGWMGGGDVKLSAAVFLWAGPEYALAVLAVVSISGLAIAVACLCADVILRLSLPSPLASGVGWFSSRRGVPYGIALSAGGAFAALASLSPGG